MAEEHRPIRVTEQQGKQVAGSDGSVSAVVGASEQGQAGYRALPTKPPSAVLMQKPPTLGQ